MHPLRRGALSLACLLALCAPAFAQTPAPATSEYVPGGRIPQLQGEFAIVEQAAKVIASDAAAICTPARS